MSGFAERLAAGRAILEKVRAHGPLDLPVALSDQIWAATDHAHRQMEALDRVLREVVPERMWISGDSAITDDPAVLEVSARVFAAWAACHPCPHLSSPQPAWARLSLHRIDCARCRMTDLDPPDGEDDRCDWCEARGITHFYPICIQFGPLIVMGDACDDCKGHLTKVVSPG